MTNPIAITDFGTLDEATREAWLDNLADLRPTPEDIQHHIDELNRTLAYGGIPALGLAPDACPEAIAAATARATAAFRRARLHRPRRPSRRRHRRAARAARSDAGRRLWQPALGGLRHLAATYGRCRPTRAPTPPSAGSCSTPRMRRPPMSGRSPKASSGR